MNFCRKHWFMLAWLAPGKLVPQPVAGSVRLACIISIFLISGLTLPTAQMRSSLGNWRLHAFVQVFSFGLIPLFFLGLEPLLARLGMSEGVRQGFLVLASVPTTVATSVAITALARGNEAAAVCNAALGNLLGIFISPFLIYLLLSTQYQAISYFSVIRELSLLVILPIICGQGLQKLKPEFWKKRRKQLGIVSNLLLITIIYTVFSATFRTGLELSGGVLIAVLLVAGSSHLLLLYLSWLLSALPWLRLERPERIAAMICATQKTVAMGIPLITVIFKETPEVIGIMSLPLLCYHPLQLFIDSLVASSMGASGVKIK